MSVEMWNLTSGKGQQWGVQGYKVPRIYHDAQRIKQEKENMLYAQNKKKRPKQQKVNMNLKRGDFLEQEVKRTQSVPAPWQYDLRQKWMTGHYPDLKQPAPKDLQKMKFRWKGVDKDKQEYQNNPSIPQKKIDKNVKKFTYIDQIVKENSKKNYPKPGPADYHMDDKAIKKFHKNNPSLFEKKLKNENKKTNLPNFLFSNSQKNALIVPAPGYCQPDMKKQKKPEESKVTYKKYKELKKEKEKYNQAKRQREKERINEIKEKVKFDIKQIPEPIPQNFNTFDYIKKQSKKIAPKKNPMGFGVGQRFKKTEKEKWDTLVATHNKNAEKKISTKSDPIPGPQHYSLICHWKGKVNKKDKDKENNKRHYLNAISKKPIINAYYRKV